MFQIKERNSTVKTEIVAGITTFLTMAYILVVNPMVLGDAHVPFSTAFFATVVVIVVGTAIMALVANYPIAIAPGMGLNAYFAYSVVQPDKGIDYTIAFAAVFVTGLLFMLISFTSLRSKLIEIIPDNLKHAISTGIGLFVAFIGLRLSGLVTTHPSNLVALGDLHSLPVILTLVGLALTIFLYVLNVPGAIFIGMILTGFIAYVTGELRFDNGVFAFPTFPDQLVVSNPISAIGTVIDYSLYAVVFSFLLVTLFDTTGTLVGVSQQAGLMVNGKLERSGQAMLADSVATTVGSMLGTSPSTAYIESTAGVAAGGRTGLTSVVVACLFGVSLFFAPLIGAISSIPAITAPALIIVGSLMLSNVQHINFNTFEDSFPAFLVILSMPFTSSIATGIALGFITYPLLKIASGKWKQVHPLLYVFAVLFIIQLVLIPH